MKQITREQAIEMSKNNWWTGLPEEAVVVFQLFQDRLALPFEEFHRCLEVSLGRPVYTHEMVNLDGLQKEFLGDRPAPTFQEILDLIPEEKRIVVVIELEEER